MSLPIRALEAADAARVEAHLLRLSPGDRSLRFAGGVVTDEAIRRHVAGIRFGSDALLAMLDDRGAVLALAHGCVFRVGERLHVEVAFSVDLERRGRGIATALMAAMRDFAESIGADTVRGMCLARNLPMRRVFAHAGMAMTREEDEVHACCRLAAGRVEAGNAAARRDAVAA